LSLQLLRQLRAKAAVLLAENSFKAKTGIFRRQTYVLFAFQTKFALTFVLLSAFNTVMSAVVVYQLLGGAENGVDFSGVIANLTSFEPRTVWLFSTLLVLLIASFALLYFVTLVATHRVAGPIAVMRKHLTSLLSGHYPAMRPLRQHDELKDFFMQLWKLVDQLRAKDMEESKVLHQVLDSLAPGVTGIKGQEALASLKALIDAKQRALGETKLGAVAPIMKNENATPPIRIASQ
jgi:hypothetical protein